jgi:hypothetical protein
MVLLTGRKDQTSPNYPPERHSKKGAQSNMNRQMQMRKDEFRTDDEKDAWQQGYISSIEVLTDLHQDLPENLHGALCAGWWCAFEDATKRRR